MIAGYWAIHTRAYKTISYYGCDLVFEPHKNDGRTHFYGVSDHGPLHNDHPSMRRQDLKSVRLFVWGLLNGVVLLNASALEGSKLAFPPCSLIKDQEAYYNRIMHSRATRDILALGQDAFAFEKEVKTPAFDGPWGACAKDRSAIEILDLTLKKWEPVLALCHTLRTAVMLDSMFTKRVPAE